MLSDNQRAFGAIFVMILVIVVPAAITLDTVEKPGVRQIPPDPTPYGYSWSLLLFIVPLVALAVWFLAAPRILVSEEGLLAHDRCASTARSCSRHPFRT